MSSRQLKAYTECTQYFYDFEVLDREFVETSDSEKEELWQRLLLPSLGHEQGCFFLRFLAGCIGGFVSSKLFLLVVGSSNSGKGVLTELVQRASNCRSVAQSPGTTS
jgi:hypothetical protein